MAVNGQAPVLLEFILLGDRQQQVIERIRSIITDRCSGKPKAGSWYEACKAGEQGKDAVLDRRAGKFSLRRQYMDGEPKGLKS